MSDKHVVSTHFSMDLLLNIFLNAKDLIGKDVAATIKFAENLDSIIIHKDVQFSCGPVTEDINSGKIIYLHDMQLLSKQWAAN